MSKANCKCFVIDHLTVGFYQLGFLVSFDEALNTGFKMPENLVATLSISKVGQSPFLSQTVQASQLIPGTLYYLMLPADHLLNKAAAEKRLPVFFSVGLRTGSPRIQVERPHISYDEGNAYYYAYGYETAAAYGPDFGRDLAFEPSATEQYLVKCEINAPVSTSKLKNVSLAFEIRR